MSCLPTYKGKRYDSLEELYRANGINPQQKQQALQQYSQYLDSLIKPNTNPILQGNQQKQVKKFAELQERLNNKEFLEGAKFAYESTPALQQFGTQEQYNDYIARVSLGILKNPSSGEYNYESKVKDIVYHGTAEEINDKFNPSFIAGAKKSKNRLDNIGVYVTPMKEYAQKYAQKVIGDTVIKGKVLSLLINANNVERAKDSRFEDLNKELKNELYPNADAIYGEHLEFQKDEYGILPKIHKNLYKAPEYVVFEPEQIHILGSKQDIEGFKKFVEQPINKEIKPKIDSSEKAENSQIDFQEEQTTGYRNRTIKNASADATIALATDFTSAGEKLTKTSVLGQNKKYIPIDANSLEVTQERVDKIVEALNSVNAKTLNIAGNGIYTMKGKYTQQQVDDFTYDLLNQVLNSPNLTNKIESIRSGGQTGFDEAGAKAGIKLGLPTIILAPKGYTFRNVDGKDISNEQQFKARFESDKSTKLIKDRIRIDYPINIENISSVNLQQIANIPNISKNIITFETAKATTLSEYENYIKKTYGKAAYLYVVEIGAELTSDEGEWLKANEQVGIEYVNLYLQDERAEGKSLQDFASQLLKENEILVDTAQNKLFDESVNTELTSSGKTIESLGITQEEWNELTQEEQKEILWQEENCAGFARGGKWTKLK